MPRAKKQSVENKVRDIRRKTRRKYSAEEKIRIVLEGLRGEETVAELCRREGIAKTLYYSWSKEFLEAGKARLTGDTKRSATNSEVIALKEDVIKLKQLAAELMLENRALKKTLLTGEGGMSRDLLISGWRPDSDLRDDSLLDKRILESRVMVA